MNEKYIVELSSNLQKALEKISLNECGCVIVVDSLGSLKGVISDGDIREYILSNELQNKIISEVMNKDPFYLILGQNYSNDLLKKYKLIPIVDENKRVIKIKSIHGELLIGKSILSSKNQTYFIAEIGNNHQGDVKLGYKLIDEAVRSGANAVKFQHRYLDVLYRKADVEDLGVEYTKSLLDKFSLKWIDLKKLFDYSRSKGVDLICTPFDTQSASDLITYKVDAIKISSADFINHSLIKLVQSTGIPLILSTGMSTESEILATHKVLSEGKSDYALLHCNSTYPAPYEDLNLNFLKSLIKYTQNGLVGWSGHERGYHICIGAVALGAKIIEKHFTLDKNLEGNDHKVSLLPGEFKSMVREIRNLEKSFGSDKRIISQGEMINRENLGKSLVASHDIPKNKILSKKDFHVKSPGRGIPPYRINEFIGRQIKRNLPEGEFIFDSHMKELIEDTIISTGGYECGIPVRFHDLNDAKGIGNLVEFHLTNSDLDRHDLIKNIKLPSNIKNFVVHSPELFANDDLLNIASLNQNERENSKKYLQQVIEVVEHIKRVTKINKTIKIVVNVGGFSKSEFITDRNVIRKMYENVNRILTDLNCSSYEFIIQTMPPFPWHFGGQSYHNLFIDPKIIVKFCKKTNLKLCLDISHTFLACTYLKIDFYQAIKDLLPYSSHLHISDAEGLNGEGLQIDEGEINWVEISSIFNISNYKFSYIPEIWQGHKEKSKEAKIALTKIIKYINKEL